MALTSSSSSAQMYWDQYLLASGGVVKVEHSILEPRVRFYCVKCGESFTSDDMVLSETSIDFDVQAFVKLHNGHHRNPTWKCEFCGGNFKSSVGIKQHAAMCPGGKPVTSSTCTACFQSGGHSPSCPKNVAPIYKKYEDLAQLELFHKKAALHEAEMKAKAEETKAIQAAMEAYKKSEEEAEQIAKIAKLQTEGVGEAAGPKQLKMKPGMIIDVPIGMQPDTMLSLDEANEVLKAKENALMVKELKAKLKLLESQTPVNHKEPTPVPAPPKAASNLLKVEGRKFR